VGFDHEPAADFYPGLRRPGLVPFDRHLVRGKTLNSLRLLSATGTGFRARIWGFRLPTVCRNYAANDGIGSKRTEAGFMSD
jgi:hypothetical protein